MSPRSQQVGSVAAANEDFADLGAGSVDFDGQQLVMRGEIGRVEGMSGTGEHGEVAAVPKFLAFLPTGVDGGFADGSAGKPVGTDDVPDFATVGEKGFEGVIAGKGFLFEVEEFDAGVGDAFESDVAEGGAADGRDVGDIGLVGAWSAGDDEDFVEVLGEQFGDLTMVQSGWIEAASEKGDAAGHGGRLRRMGLTERINAVLLGVSLRRGKLFCMNVITGVACHEVDVLVVFV